MKPQISNAQVATTQISVINESTVLTDAEVTPVVIALQQQVTNDFRPIWGTDAELNMVPQGHAGARWDLGTGNSRRLRSGRGTGLPRPDSRDGLPLGKIFAASDLKAGTSWSVTASHELLEMLADPNINLTAFVQNANTSGTLYAYEVCDACEDDSFGYLINNILGFRLCLTLRGLKAFALQARRSLTG